MTGSVRRSRGVLATLIVAGSLLSAGLLGGCSRFEAERAELRHEHVVLNADSVVVVAVPVD